MENSANNKVGSTVIEETVEKANQSLKKETPADIIQSKANANPTLKKNRQLILANKLVEAGAHIGLHPRKWNPKMKPYIYAKRSNNHVINMVKTLNYLNNAYTFLEELTKQGGRVLLVGTNGEIIKNLIAKEAKRAKAFYVSQRWLGGTLTNFKNISKSIKKFNDNLALIKSGELSKYTKKEQLQIKKDTDKLSKFYSGIKNMKKLPQAMIILDTVIDKNAVLEAKKLNIPVIGLANTNANPDLIDYIVPVNNNSYRTIYLVLGVLIDAIASVNNEPTKFVGKPNEQIILPELPTKRKNPYVNGSESKEQALEK